MANEISDEVKQYLLLLARSTIAKRLGIPFDMPKAVCDPAVSEVCGAFVSLHINGGLRGCIGYIVGCLPLCETIEEMALAAAFRDPRFPPLTVDEFDKIDLKYPYCRPLNPWNLWIKSS